MAIYEYRCDQDGVFEVMRPLGTAPATVACPACNREAPRIVSAPMILTTSRSAWSAAIERADKTRYEPEVVTSVPAAGAKGRTRMLPLTPTLRGLPRPDPLRPKKRPAAKLSTSGACRFFASVKCFSGS